MKISMTGQEKGLYKRKIIETEAITIPLTHT